MIFSSLNYVTGDLLRNAIKIFLTSATFYRWGTYALAAGGYVVDEVPDRKTPPP